VVHSQAKALFKNSSYDLKKPSVDSFEDFFFFVPPPSHFLGYFFIFYTENVKKI